MYGFQTLSLKHLGSGESYRRKSFCIIFTRASQMPEKSHICKLLSKFIVKVLFDRPFDVSQMPGFQTLSLKHLNSGESYRRKSFCIIFTRAAQMPEKSHICKLLSKFMFKVLFDRPFDVSQMPGFQTLSLKHLNSGESYRRKSFCIIFTRAAQMPEKSHICKLLSKFMFKVLFDRPFDVSQMPGFQT